MHPQFSPLLSIHTWLVKGVGLRVLLFWFFSLGISLAQAQPMWDSGEVRSPAAGTHSEAVPQLRVQKDWIRYTLEYQTSDPAQIKNAWIEVWDRPLLLLRQPVSAAGGKMLWEDNTDAPPKRLEIALLDPDYKPQYICFDECDPEDLKKIAPTSNLIVGIGPDEDPPYPELQMQSARVLAGSGELETVLNGLYLSPPDRLLVAEFDPVKRAYNHLQFLPFEFLDLYHLKVSVPSFLLQQPRILVFSVMPPAEDHREQEPVFDGTFKSWMPGIHDNAFLIVAQPESPAIERLEPKEIHGGADEFQSTTGNEAQQSSYEQHGVHVLVHGHGFDRDSQVFVGSGPFSGQRLPTEFLSSHELRFWVESSKYTGSIGFMVPLWITNQKKSCAISNPITFNILPAVGMQPPVPAGDIYVTEPYPIPLVRQDGPKAMEFIVRGKNFRPNVTVVASNDGGGVFNKLKTVFVSPEELRAWLPQGMWRTHRLSFRFVVQTEKRKSAVEIQAPE
jgi:hypothetical protein